MTRLRSCLMLSVLLGLFACSEAPQTDETQAIRKAAAAWVKAYKAGDIDGLMALYTPDAFVALNGQPAMRGKDAIRAYFEPRLGTAEVEFVLDFEEIEVHGDVAHLSSRYWYIGVPKSGGEAVQDAGRSVLIYKRAATGDWQIYLDIDQQTPDVSFPVPIDLVL